MKDLNLTLVYFSPTGTSKKTLLNIAEGMGCKEYNEIDLTDFNNRWQKRTFAKDELVLFAMPVYYGRLPLVGKEIFNHIKAIDTPVVPVAVYGNIVLDDALLELKNNLEEVGFKTIGAAAFIGQHSLNENVATSRPNDSDRIQQIEFGKAILEKYNNIGHIDNANVQVPGNYPYRKGADIPLAPQLVGDCNNCKICRKHCPVFAIDPNNPSNVDNFRCILCFRCVRICSKNAREITNEKVKLGFASLVLRGAQPKEPQVFI